MWKTYALLSAFFAALTAIFSKMGVKDVDSNLALAVRVAFILMLTWGIVIFSGSIKAVKSLSSSTWMFLAFSAITTGLSWLFYFKALQYGDVSKVAPLDKLSVPIAMVIAIIFLGEPLTIKIVVGGCLIIAGSLVLLSS